MNNVSKTYELIEGEKQKPINNPFGEVTRANSTLYPKYQYRPYNPDTLYQKRGNYDLFDDMLEDDQIRSLMHMKKLMILDSEWELECDDEIPETLEDEIKDFIEYNLQNMPMPLEKKMYEMLSCLSYGFSLTEKIFMIGEYDGQAKIMIKDIKTRSPHSFTIYQKDTGDVDYIEQDMDGNYINISYEKFLHYVNQGDFDNPYGTSDLSKGVYVAWWSKEQIQKFWNIYLEKYGSPTVIGKYGAQHANQKDELLTVLKRIQTNTAMAVPLEVEVSLLESQNSDGGKQFKEAIDHYNRMIARSMLIPDLMGVSGDATSGGAYALGREQFGLFWAVIEQHRSDLERLINKNIVEPLVKMNYGDYYLQFRFKKADDSKREKNLDLWLRFLNVTKQVSPEHREWFNQQIEAPIDETLPEPQDTPQDGENQQDKQDQQNDQQNDQEEQKVEKKKLKTFVQDNIQQIKSDFDTLENKYLKKAQTAMRSMVKDVADYGELIRDIRGIQELTLNPEPLVNVVKDLAFEAFRRGGLSVTKELNFELTSEEIAIWIEQFSYETANAEAEYLLRTAKPIIADGIRNGYGSKKIVKQLLDKFGRDDLENRLDTMVRTITSRAYNEARLREFEEIQDEIIAYEFDAILDNRTSDICNHFNGMIFPVKDGRIVNPPLHMRCRSLLRPILKGQERKIQGQIDKVPTEIPVTRKGGTDMRKIEKVGNFYELKTPNKD